jgi:hypothetical protein
MVLAAFVTGLVARVGACLRQLAASRSAVDAAVDLPSIAPSADVEDRFATRAHRLP